MTLPAPVCLHNTSPRLTKLGCFPSKGKPSSSSVRLRRISKSGSIGGSGREAASVATSTSLERLKSGLVTPPLKPKGQHSFSEEEGQHRDQQQHIERAASFHSDDSDSVAGYIASTTLSGSTRSFAAARRQTITERSIGSTRKRANTSTSDKTAAAAETGDISAVASIQQPTQHSYAANRIAEEQGREQEDGDEYYEDQPDSDEYERDSDLEQNDEIDAIMSQMKMSKSRFLSECVFGLT